MLERLFQLESLATTSCNIVRLVSRQSMKITDYTVPSHIFGHAVHSRQVVLFMDFRVSPTVPTLTYRGFSRAEALRPGWHWMAKVQPLSCGSKVKHTIQDTPPSERHSKSFAVPDGRHVIWTSSEHVDVEQRPVRQSESKVCTRTQKSNTVRCWSKERIITILSRPFGFVGKLEGTISAVATYSIINCINIFINQLAHVDTSTCLCMLCTECTVLYTIISGTSHIVLWYAWNNMKYN